MVVLKKIKAATLMETLVATVIIVLVFMISSLLLNSLFENTIRNNTDAVKTKLTELLYLYEHEQIQIPYEDEFQNWQITIEKENDWEVAVEAFHKEKNKTINLKRYAK